MPDVRPQSGFRAPRHAQAVPRRLDPDRLSAHDHDGLGRRRAVSRSRAGCRQDAAHSTAVAGGGGFLPRGLGHRPPHHVPHRPSRDAAHRGRHRARPANAVGSPGRCASGVGSHARHRTRAPRAGCCAPGRQRLDRRRPSRRDQGRAPSARSASPRTQRSLSSTESVTHSRRVAPAGRDARVARHSGRCAMGCFIPRRRRNVDSGEQ